jgi:hypothetical protein
LRRAADDNVKAQEIGIKIPSFRHTRRGGVMATLTGWKFNTPQGADEALEKLEKPNRDLVINALPGGTARRHG